MSLQIPYGRAEGKTFRKVLDALQSASGGKVVIYLCSHEQEVKRVYSAAVTIVRALCGGHDITHDHDKKTIRFPNGGSVKFYCNWSSEETARRFKGNGLTFIHD